MDKGIKVLTCFSAFFISAALLRAGEHKMTLASAPAVIQAAVKKTLPDRKITNISEEEADGKTVYEAEFDVSGVEHSALFSADGKLLEEEEEIAAADLPAAVSATVKTACPDGKIKEISKVVADGKTFYEADVISGKNQLEIKVAPDGALMSKKVETDEGAESEKQERERAGKI